ncbi:MAG: TonB family protein, partial [Gemmatimonadetes bacterium]|nr:TonB family protein [Gemmatimonadota bacterium]
LDGRSDLYSLGLVGWELLAGQQPWEGENLYSIIVKQRTEPLPSLELLRPGVPEPLRLAIERATEKDHSRRWSNAEELLAHLDRGAAPVEVPQAGAAEAGSAGESLSLAPTARGEYITVEFRPTAVVSDSSLVPDLAPASVVPRTRPAWPAWRGGTRTYLAAAGVVLFAGGAAMIPLIGTGTPTVQAANAFLPAPAPLLAGPPPVDASQSEEPAPPSETPPEAVEPTPATPPPPPKTETARAEIPSAVPDVKVALSLTQQHARDGYPAPAWDEIQPKLTPVAAPQPSSRVVSSPEIAPELNNRAAVVRLLDFTYPSILRDRQIGGKVMLSLLIDEAGTVIESNLRSSSGHSLLDDAAVRIGRSMSFTPAQHQGRQVRTRVEIPLVFDAQAPRE